MCIHFLKVTIIKYGYHMVKEWGTKSKIHNVDFGCLNERHNFGDKGWEGPPEGLKNLEKFG